MMLDLRDRPVLIVGGGSVAVRKARGLLDAGATRVRCVSPAFHADLPPQVRRVQEGYRAAHLDGPEAPSLVFAATNVPAVNEAVVRDARERRILVNRADADEQEPGDFSTPAKFGRGPVVVSVSAGSPALAAFIRDRIAEQFQPVWAEMADAMQLLRPIVLSAAGLDEARRRIIFRELASAAALDVLPQRGRAG